MQNVMADTIPSINIIDYSQKKGRNDNKKIIGELREKGVLGKRVILMKEELP